MAKKDKFAQMQQRGGAGSFQQTLVQAATTVAAIERQNEAQEKNGNEPSPEPSAQKGRGEPMTAGSPQQPFLFTRLPNPQIPLQEYNLVSGYCAQFANMTRQDFVELAIIEKLHAVGSMSDDEFNARHAEITSRPPRGHRKGTKQTIK